MSCLSETSLVLWGQIRAVLEFFFEYSVDLRKRFLIQQDVTREKQVLR